MINASWGDYGDFDPLLYNAIKAAGEAGILFVGAAGNGDALGHGIDLDGHAHGVLPGQLRLGQHYFGGRCGAGWHARFVQQLWAQSIDLLAPGVGILTTDRSSLYSNPAVNAYVVRNGTSFAAPFVSGVAALIAANKPATPFSEIRDAILEGVTENLPALSGIVASKGIVNADGALRAPMFAPKATALLVGSVNQPNVHRNINVTFTSEVGIALLLSSARKYYSGEWAFEASTECFPSRPHQTRAIPCASLRCITRRLPMPATMAVTR